MTFYFLLLLDEGDLVCEHNVRMLQVFLLSGLAWAVAFMSGFKEELCSSHRRICCVLLPGDKGCDSGEAANHSRL